MIGDFSWIFPLTDLEDCFDPSISSFGGNVTLEEMEGFDKRIKTVYYYQEGGMDYQDWILIGKTTDNIFFFVQVDWDLRRRKPEDVITIKASRRLHSFLRHCVDPAYRDRLKIEGEPMIGEFGYIFEYLEPEGDLSLSTCFQPVTGSRVTVNHLRHFPYSIESVLLYDHSTDYHWVLAGTTTNHIYFWVEAWSGHEDGFDETGTIVIKASWKKDHFLTSCVPDHYQEQLTMELQD